MKFFSSFNVAKVKPCPTGNGTEVDWQLRKVKGVDELVDCGVVNVYERIQACLDSAVDVNKLVDQYLLTADNSIFEQRKNAQYFDLTKVPKDIFEMQALTDEAQLKFDQLPIAIKQKYDNNLYNFIMDDKAFEKVKDFFAIKPDFKQNTNGKVSNSSSNDLKEEKTSE